MKKQLLSFFVLLFIAFGCTNTSNKTVDETYAFEEIKTMDSADFYKLSIDKPLLLGSKSGDTNHTARVFKHAVDTFLLRMTADFRGNQLDSLKALVALSSSGAGVEKVIANVILLEKDPFYSVRFSVYEYMLGAHGFTQLFSFNYRSSDQSFLSIQDVLKLNDNNIEAVNQLLAEYFENPDSCFDQMPQITPDFALFNLTEKGVLFSYEAYELGAYFCGSPEILLPYRILKEKGLLQTEFENFAE